MDGWGLQIYSRLVTTRHTTLCRYAEEGYKSGAGLTTKGRRRLNLSNAVFVQICSAPTTGNLGNYNIQCSERRPKMYLLLLMFALLNFNSNFIYAVKLFLVATIAFLLYFIPQQQVKPRNSMLKHEACF